MRARLYRGPLNGKVLLVPDDQKTIVVKELEKPKRRRRRKLKMHGTVQVDSNFPATLATGGTIQLNTWYQTPVLSSSTGTHLHFEAGGPPTEMVKYRDLIYRRTKHTHPDGSVFFEWDK